jgi:outer membrane protein
VTARRSLIILMVLAAGCAVDQEKEVARYRRIVDISTTQPIAAPVAGAPLTLRDALLLANQQNERLSIEGENYLQALIDRRRAAAAFLPTISLAPTYTFRDRSGGGADNPNTGAAGSAARTEIFDAPVSGEMNLFNGFGDVARYRASGATIEQRRALLLDLQEQLLLDVADVYYQVLRSEESVRVLENSLTVQDARLRDVRGRRDAGTVRPLDVAQVEAQASSTRVSLLAARNDVRTGRALLEFLTAAPVGDAPLVDEYAVPDQIPAADELHTTALQRRRDLQAAEAATRAARQDVEAAVSQYYPSVTLDANVFLYRESSPTDRDWDAILRANLPIFSAGLIEADVREAWSLFRQAMLETSETRRQVARDVEVAHGDLAFSGQRLAELRTQLAAAQQAFEQAARSNEVGLATNLERLIAQDQLLTSQLEFVSEEFTQKLSSLALLRATGSLRERLESLPQSAGPTTRPTTQMSSAR